MSDMQNFKGKIRPVKTFDGESLEDVCKRLLGGIDLEDSCDTYEEMLREKNWDNDKFFVVNGQLYENFECKEMDYFESDIHFFDIGNGEFGYSTSFHNGGTCLTEMLENFDIDKFVTNEK